MGDPVADRVAFARMVLGRDPFPHQAEALRSAAPFVVVAGGRRSGKSEAAQVAALHGCFTHAGAEWLVTSANADNARVFVAEAAHLLRGTELGRGAVVDVEAMRIDFANGSALVGLPPTPAQLRGRGRLVIGVTWEEAGFAPPTVFRDGRYVLLDNRAAGAQGWLIGSPWGDGFFFEAHRAGLDGDRDFAAFVWPTALNPRLPADWIERERARLNSLEAAAELDGVWSSEGQAFFPRALLDSCVADVELPGLGRVGGGAPGVASIDFGVVYDHSAAVGVWRLPVAGLNPEREPSPVFVAVPHVWAQGVELRRVVDDAAGWPGFRAARYVAPDVTGVGAMAGQELSRALGRTRGRRVWCPLHWSMPLKMAAYGTLRWLLERGQLLLPRDPVLLRQMAGMRFEPTARGGGRIEAETAATHDDVVDALAGAMLPYSPRGSRRVVCEMGRLADPARAAPDAPADCEGWELVSTGGGLVVPRTPVLQGVVDGSAMGPPRAAVAPRPAGVAGLDAERLELRRRVLARVDGVGDDANGV